VVFIEENITHTIGIGNDGQGSGSGNRDSRKRFWPLKFSEVKRVWSVG